MEMATVYNNKKESKHLKSRGKRAASATRIVGKVDNNFIGLDSTSRISVGNLESPIRVGRTSNEHVLDVAPTKILSAGRQSRRLTIDDVLGGSIDTVILVTIHDVIGAERGTLEGSILRE